jgi:hypothetical protein
MYTQKHNKEIPCVATFISNKKKMSNFLFSFFSSTKSENRRVEQVLSRRGRGGRERG